MIAAPVRIRLGRTKGWQMPESAIFVGAGSKWSMWDSHYSSHNKKAYLLKFGKSGSEFELREFAVNNFQKNLVGNLDAISEDSWTFSRSHINSIKKSLQDFELLGRNLVCTCRLDYPCHADVLLALANRTNS